MLSKRVVSPDFTCGGENAYTCPGTLCCSQYGWCGSTSEYCGEGCQADFGTCSSSGGGGGGGGGSGGDDGEEEEGGSGGDPPPSGGGDGGSVENIPRPTIGSVPYGTVISECANAGDIALTFDDGPHTPTDELLDLLDQENVKATFFITGNSFGGPIDENAQLSATIRRTFDAGHQVAAHTWTHPDLTTLSSAARREEMFTLEAALANILGVIPTYMRPPFLAFNEAVGQDMIELGYHVITTNLDTRDWANQTPDTVSNSVEIFENAVAGSSSSNFNVLAHDIHQTTVQTLAPEMIRISKEAGLNIVTVGECLNDPAGNWYRQA